MSFRWRTIVPLKRWRTAPEFEYEVYRKGHQRQYRETLEDILAIESMEGYAEKIFTGSPYE